MGVHVSAAEPPQGANQAALAIEPARFTLEPGEERSVTLRGYRVNAD